MDRHSDTSRSRLVTLNILASIAVKGWGAAVVFLLVPLTLRCLGAYANGVWMTISAILVWVDQMDIGLGNGLRNRLATCIAHDDMEGARRAVASTMALLALVVTIMAGGLLVVVAVADVDALLGISGERIADLRTTLAVVVVLFCSSFALRTVGHVYMGLQLPAANSAMVVAGQTLTLIGTYAVSRCLPGNFMAIALVNTASPLLVYIVAWGLTFRWRYPALRPTLRYADMTTARELVSTGLKFFALQISGIVLFTSSNVIIAHLFTPEMVTPYQVAYRYFSIVLMGFGILSTPFWTATTDAYERGDMEWIVRSGRRLNLCLLATYIGIAAMVVIAPWFYEVWVGHDVTVDPSLTVATAVYVATFVTSVRYSTVLNGCGKLRLQLIMTMAAATAFIPLSIAAIGWHHSVATLLLVMAAVNVPGLVVNKLQYDKIINYKATGIWNK